MSMLIPVRCFSCNKVIANLWETYQQLLESGKGSGEVTDAVRCNALDAVGLKRYCCRRMFLGHVELIDRVIKYEDTTLRFATVKTVDDPIKVKRVYLAR